MTTCPHCDSTSVQSRGTKTNQSGVSRKRHQCNDCLKWFSVKDEYVPVEEAPKVQRFSSRMPESFKQYDRFVISAVQNDTEVNQEFLYALQTYCERKNAKLILVPIKYKFTQESVFDVDPDYIQVSDVLLSKKLRLLAHVQITPTIPQPPP